MQELIFFLIAALSLFITYKVLGSLFKVLPESGFRSFMISVYGQIFTGFTSLFILYVAYIFVLVNILGIRC